MSILTEAQAKAILDKVIAFSTADEASAQLTGGTQGNVRFARNDISTSGIVDDVPHSNGPSAGLRIWPSWRPKIRNLCPPWPSRPIRRPTPSAKPPLR
jgi:hypothetical protein